MKKSFRLLGAAAVFTTMFAMTSLAATKITNVELFANADGENQIQPGIVTAPVITAESDQFEVVSVSMAESSSFKMPRTFEVILSATDDNYFPNEKEVNVKGHGISSIYRKHTDDEYQMTIKLKAYPYYQWPAPEIKEADLVNGKSIKWDDFGAPKVEYIITYTDKDGEERERQGTATSSLVSITAYNKKATAKEKENGRQDMEVTGFAVRGLGHAGENNRTIASPWTVIGDVAVDNFDYVTYETWAEAFPESTGSASSGATASKPSFKPNNNSQAGWKGSGNDWYWVNANGSKGTGWIYDGQNWYLCDNNGRMQAGWYFDGTNWFYLNEQHDGTYGRMLTGWQNIGGHTFYLNPVSDGTRGAMFVGWRNVDGQNRYFNEAHDGTFGRLIK